MGMGLFGWGDFCLSVMRRFLYHKLKTGKYMHRLTRQKNYDFKHEKPNEMSKRIHVHAIRVCLGTGLHVSVWLLLERLNEVWKHRNNQEKPHA